MLETRLELVRFSCNQIQKGSKSFAFASFFLNPEQRAGAWLLYSFCRYCDDQIDNSDDSEWSLQNLEHELTEALASEVPVSNPHMEGIRLVCRDFSIPHKYPFDLLRGMKMDVQGRRYRTIEELQEYCYCVAGVVGLMMCHVMGVSDERALDHAVSMGSAMQLTNISRDVADDWRMGRIYFPMNWLAAADVDPKDFGDERGQSFWAVWTEQLLHEASLKYEHGRQGLQFLSPKAALACGIAGSVYSRIGAKVLRRKSLAWRRRVFVPLWEKVLFAFVETARLGLQRLWTSQPWNPKPIKIVWNK